MKINCFIYYLSAGERRLVAASLSVCAPTSAGRALARTPQSADVSAPTAEREREGGSVVCGLDSVALGDSQHMAPLRLRAQGSGSPYSRCQTERLEYITRWYVYCNVT